MNTIADTLRECAYGLPIEENSFDGVFGGKARTGSPYICDNLERIDSTNGGDNGAKAALFLRELGMGRGYGEFMTEDDYRYITFNYSRKHQFARAAWLLFAADLAEEWGVE